MHRIKLSEVRVYSAGAVREKRGGCIASLSYVAGSEEQIPSESGKLVWKYSFSKRQSSQRGSDMQAANPTPADLRQSGIPEGDLMVLSVDGESLNRSSAFAC